MIRGRWTGISTRAGRRQLMLTGGSVIAAGLAYYVAVGSVSRIAEVLTLLIAVSVLALVVALSRRDAGSMLTLVLVALFVIPENYVIVGPLRSVGNPALLAGLACAAVWVVGRWSGSIRAAPMHPFRWTVLGFGIASLTSFAAALSRILVTQESDSAARTIFPTIALLGIAMLASDGLVGADAVAQVLRRFVFLASLEAVIGAVEFFTAIDYHELMRIPGLTLNTELNDQTRSGFARIEAAAAHPIEFSVAMAIAVPFALHFALHASSRREARGFWVCLTLLVGVIPLTLSRSGLLALAVVVLVYGVALRGRARVNLLVLSALGLVAFPVLAPGILGTVRSFIFAGTKDNSITGRLDDYARIPGLMDGHWWFGRGLGTFQPLVYFFLDNQYLMALLTGGVVGLVAFVAVFVVGSGVARGARKRFSSPRDRDLGQALAAAILGIAATAATFDLFSFYQCAFTLFLLSGCAAALWTAARAEEHRRESDAASGPRQNEMVLTP